jgi:hypothetical protein
VQRRLPRELVGADLLGEPQRQTDRVGTVGARQHEDELVAAVAEERVPAAYDRLDPLGELPEHLVTAQVPVRVVDRLEEVDIEQENRAGAAATGRPREF